MYKGVVHGQRMIRDNVTLLLHCLTTIMCLVTFVYEYHLSLSAQKSSDGNFSQTRETDFFTYNLPDFVEN